jgi:hypothetical protein
MDVEVLDNGGAVPCVRHVGIGENVLHEWLSNGRVFDVQVLVMTDRLHICGQPAAQGRDSGDGVVRAITHTFLEYLLYLCGNCWKNVVRAEVVQQLVNYIATCGYIHTKIGALHCHAFCSS